MHCFVFFLFNLSLNFAHNDIWGSIPIIELYVLLLDHICVGWASPYFFWIMAVFQHNYNPKAIWTAHHLFDNASKHKTFISPQTDFTVRVLFY